MNTPGKNISEGRARLACPSLCLAVMVAAMLLVAPAAQALPPTPRLNGTTPVSPSTSLTPLIYGSSDGVIKSSIPGPSTSALHTSFETNPANVIKLFTNPGCEGAPATQGTAGELDGAGIQVTVKPDTTTSFYANQTDVSGTSECSGALTYQHMTKLPEPPPAEPPASNPPGVGGPRALPSAPRLRTVPGGTANDNTPLVTGSAPGASVVKIFTTADCSGAPVARGSAAQFASAGLEVQVVDNVVVAFFGISVAAGGGQSSCSAPVFYVEDSTTPHTRITMGPSSKTRKRSAIFRFTDSTGNAPGTTFFCKIDRRRWKQCSSPLRLRGLHPRRYVLRVKATDPAGNREATGAKRRFKVVPRL
jgi:hypothetical protein